MAINSIGAMTTDNVKQLVSYLRSNDSSMREAVSHARKDLPAFLESAFDLPDEIRTALREVLTPGLSAALIEMVMEAIEGGAELEVEAAQPTDRSVRPLVFSIETTSTAAGAGGPKRLRVKCKPEDGEGLPPVRP